MNWPDWIVVPIVLPLLAGAAALLLERRSPRAVRALSVTVTFALLALAIYLASVAAGGTVHSYLLGNWKAPFGIALALDRLSALMLVLTAVVGVGSVLYACGKGPRGAHDAQGAHYHALFQFQLMGLNGAFLTADLFNLFVFFEVLLIASYGLLLHGRSSVQLRAAIHYVVFNLTGSALFLIAVALLYGSTGTLNMADLAVRIGSLGADGAALARVAALLLIVVFGVKAALLPLYFWLPDTYRAAPAPVAALFAIMTKVGVYCVARVTTLIFGASAGLAADVAAPWLPWLAIGTLVLAALGALAAVRLRTLVAYLVIASAGTLLLDGSATKYLDTRTLNNEGSATWQGTGAVYASNGSVFNNRGSFIVQSDAIFVQYLGAQPTFANTGVLTKTGGTGTTLFSTLVNNSGTAGHQKALSGIKWLQANYPLQSYVIPTHTERQGPFNPTASKGYNIEHFRDFNNAGPTVAFGIESPKAQGVTGRDVSTLLGEGRFREIAEYCLRDVRATVLLHRLWKERLAGIK